MARSPSLPRDLQYCTMIQQRIRITVEDARFEPHTAASASPQSPPEIASTDPQFLPPSYFDYRRVPNFPFSNLLIKGLNSAYNLAKCPDLESQSPEIP